MRAIDLGNPTYEGICAEHDAYVAALRSAGVDVTVLPALEDFPDSMFVEDPALVFTEGAILLRPGAPSRAAEAGELAPTLRGLFDEVLDLPSGHADGGDVLVTPKGVFIGIVRPHRPAPAPRRSRPAWPNSAAMSRSSKRPTTCCI